MFLFRCCVHQEPNPKTADSHDVLEVTATSVSRRVERAKEVRLVSNITHNQFELTCQVITMQASNEVKAALYRARSQPQEVPSGLGLLLDALLLQATIQTMDERPWTIMIYFRLSNCAWLPGVCAQNWTTCTRQGSDSCDHFCLPVLYMNLTMLLCSTGPALYGCRWDFALVHDCATMLL